MKKMKINLFDLLLCISNAQDLVSPSLLNHHQQVAYLSFSLAKEMHMSIDEQKDIFLAALVHDVGALSMNERFEMIENEPLSVNNHAFVGAKLLSECKPLQNEAGIIKFHHVQWENGKGRQFQGEMVPMGSHVIHLADRVCARISPNKNVLSQLPGIQKYINDNSNVKFVPNMVLAMNKLVEKEYIWLDLKASSPIRKIDSDIFDFVDLEIDDVVDLAKIFSQIIDFRSSFTARHSAGVAKTAEQLAKLAGFTPLKCKMMLVAGYLHDLGKLAVENSVLEKPGKLDHEEFNQIKMHTYYTYQLLDTIPQFKTINTWASYHHEKLDGSGYPFHIEGDQLSLGSRVMAVADVFTAIKEDRPYRDGMDDEKAIAILEGMVQSGALDGAVVGLLKKNFHKLNELREKAQHMASLRYERFL